MIDNKGVINVNSVNGIQVNIRIVEPKGAKNVRTLVSMTPVGITLHSTGNTSLSADDIAHSKYLQNVENSDEKEVGFHFVVDKDSITQVMPINEKAYHAGDGGNGYGNSKTIGVEICENDNIPKAIENAYILTCYLMHELGVDTSKVYPHREFSSTKKLCPRILLKSEATWKSDWSKVRDTIGGIYSNMYDKKVQLDNTPSSWAKEIVDRAIKDGILRGDEKGNLGLHGDITVEKTLILLYRMVDKYFPKG